MHANYTVDTLIEHTHTHTQYASERLISGKFKQGGAPCFWYAVGNAVHVCGYMCVVGCGYMCGEVLVHVRVHMC